MDLGQAQTVVDSVLRTRSPATQAAYAADLDDFRRFAKARSRAHAILSMLTGSFDDADRLVRRYRDSMASERRRNLAPSTVNRRLTVLRKISKATHRRGWTTWLLDVPNMIGDPVKDPDGPSEEKVSEMLTKAARDDSPTGRRTYALLRLFIDLGLRRGAVCGLDIGDVDLVKASARVRLKGHESKRRKNLAPATVTALERWLDAHPLRPAPKTAPLFVNLIPGRYERISGPGVWGIVKQISKSVGSPTRPHGLRHTATTRALLNAETLGETLDQVREFTDHKDFRMVLRYRNAAAGVQRKFTNANAASFGDPFASPPSRQGSKK